jgi:hypothetical protein
MKDCGVETLENGTAICSLHKQPLDDMSVLDEVVNGEYKPMMTTLCCTVGNTQFTAPYTLSRYCFKYWPMLQDAEAAWTAKDARKRADVRAQKREHVKSCNVCQGVYRLPV